MRPVVLAGGALAGVCVSRPLVVWLCDGLSTHQAWNLITSFILFGMASLAGFLNIRAARRNAADAKRNWATARENERIARLLNAEGIVRGIKDHQ